MSVTNGNGAYSWSFAISLVSSLPSDNKDGKYVKIIKWKKIMLNPENVGDILIKSMDYFLKAVKEKLS